VFKAAQPPQRLLCCTAAVVGRIPGRGRSWPDALVAQMKKPPRWGSLALCAVQQSEFGSLALCAVQQSEFYPKAAVRGSAA